MLKLERMEIRGFKSFSDPTDVRFPHGITAVVGPNGCGKSNIGDAINWVLGEQSPRILRGKQMADVIFAGTEARKPVGLAEVSLHLAGGEGLGVGENGTVVITRRLFRSGESEYLLNGQRSRLKDIQEILDRGHVGARTYATIEQGRIDQILNAKPKERRMIVEDAAGISGYKHKRRLTELKLEATHANLLRVNDVVVEVERQIRSLKRQAGRARRYRRLRDELRAKQRVEFAARALGADAELAAARAAEAGARDAEAEAAARLGRGEATLGEERSALERETRDFAGTVDRLHELDRAIDRAEAQQRHCRERIAEAGATQERQRAEGERLARRLEGTDRASEEQQARVETGRATVARCREELAVRQEEVDRVRAERGKVVEELERLRRSQFEAVSHAAEVRNELRSLDEALERNRAQRVRLEAERGEAGTDLSRLREELDDLAGRTEGQSAEVARLRAAREEAERSLSEAREGHARALEALAAAREREKSAAARLSTLEDVSTRFAGVSDGVRALLSDPAAAGLRTLGVVADFIEAGAEFENAAEGYLRAFLPTVILEDDADVNHAAELLRTQGAGRTGLISRTQPAGALAVGTSPNGSGNLPGELLADPRVRGTLRDRLTLRGSGNGVVGDRVGDALLVDSLETALELHRTYPSTDYITAEGDVVYASGWVQAGGRPAGDQGLLAHNRRTEEARTALSAAASRTAEALRTAEAGREEVARLEEELERTRTALDEASTRLVELEMRATRSAEERTRTGRRAEVLASELAALTEETERFEGQRARLLSRVGEAERESGTIAGELERSSESLRRTEAELAELVEAAARLREQLAAAHQRQEGVEDEGRRLRELVAELRHRVEVAGTEREAAREREREAREILARTESELLGHFEERDALKARAAEMEREIEGRRRRVEVCEGEVRAVRQDLDVRREATRDAELARTRAESERQHIDDLCRQELGLDAGRAVAEAQGEGVDPEAVDPAELESEIAELRERIERIGPVNLTAIEEFAELEERHRFLTAQRQDLEQSMTSLRETIRRINRTSRERFLEAFEAVRASYQEIFRLLFNGGRADLRLEEGEDVLECGIEIFAQPPGKRLSNVNLLSGGEKALSAIALLFGVFRYQPSPFCVLDEVDAALDDLNVGRFTRMLTEYARQTQFIIVTHNKVTMESADLLYGVTMQEPGVSKLVSLELH